MSFRFNQPYCGMKGSESSDATQYTPHKAWLRRLLSMLCFLLALSFLFVGKGFTAEHVIQLTAEETQDDGFGNKLLAYKMLGCSNIL